MNQLLSIAKKMDDHPERLRDVGPMENGNRRPTDDEASMEKEERGQVANGSTVRIINHVTDKNVDADRHGLVSRVRIGYIVPGGKRIMPDRHAVEDTRDY